MPLLVSYLISLAVYALMVWVFLYLPGWLVVRRLRATNDRLDTLALSLGLGMALFVAVHLVLGWSGLRAASWPVYLGLMLLAWKKGLLPMAKKPWRPSGWQIHKQGWFWLLFLVGFAVQIWINVFSGWQYEDGIRFWSAHGHDAPWHAGLMKELAERFPPRFRLLAGSKLENYHYFVDVLMGEFHRLGGFDPLDLYFRHFTFLFAALFLLLGFVFVRRWRNETAGIWAMFFISLSGSFGYIVRLVQSGSILNSEAAFWVSQTYTAIGNPPQIAAFILFITFLYLLLFWLKKPHRGLFLVLVGLSGLMPGFKIYASATLLGGLGLLAVYRLVFEKEVRTMGLFAASATAAGLTFLSNVSGGESFLVWQPWWFVRTMVVAGDRLGWMDLELRRQFYLDQGGVRGWLRVFHIELTALFLFAVGNLGTKAIGFLEMARSVWTLRKKEPLDLFLIFAVGVSFIFPLLFVQRGVAWNTGQFFQYYILLLGLFAGAWVSRWLKGMKLLRRMGVVLVLVVLSVPTVIASLIFFAPGNALAVVTNEELAGLKYLSEMTDPGAVIATGPYDQYASHQFPVQPRPIHVWDGTSYVSYFANRETYVADEGQVEIMGYPLGKQRTEQLRNVFKGPWVQEPGFSPADARALFHDKGIDYVYVVYRQELYYTPEEMGLENVFSNEAVRIYKVN